MSLGPGLSCGMDQNEGKDEPVHALDYGGFMPSSNDKFADSEGYVRIVADVIDWEVMWPES